jgi:glycine oxidase
MPQIRPIRGQMLLFRPEPGALETILYRNGLYLIPRRDGHILVGSTLEDAGFDKTTDDATCRRLHEGAAELLPELAALQPLQRWAGLRPAHPTTVPSSTGIRISKTCSSTPGISAMGSPWPRPRPNCWPI